MTSLTLGPARLLSTLLVAVFAACGGDPAGPPPPPEVGATTQALCVKDPVLLGQGRRCLDTVDCPCGATCVLGRCEPGECIIDEDCGDQFCDELGHCTAERQRRPPDFMRPLPSGELRVLPTALSAPVGAFGRSFRVSALTTPYGRVHVAADAALEVQCDPPEGAFADACDFALATSETREVVVRAAPDVPGIHDVRVTAADLSAVVTYETRAVPSAAAPTTLVGRYQGVAVLEGQGLGTTEAAATSRLAVPLGAEIFRSGSDYVVAVEDTLGWLIPSGPWVGTLAWPGDSGTLILPEREYLGGERAQFQVHLAQVTTAVTRDALEQLNFELRAEYAGLVFEGLFPSEGGAPFTRWSVRLERVGDVAGGPPAVTPAPALPAIQSYFSPTPIELQIGARIGIDNPSMLGVLCARPGDLYENDTLVGPPGAVSGDFACANGQPLAIESAELGDHGAPLDVDHLLESCLADFHDAAWNLDRIPEYRSAGCIDIQRRMVAVNYLAVFARLGANLDEERSIRVLHRMLQQWVEVLAFVSNESAQRHEVDVIAVESGAASSTRPDLVLDQAVSGWDVLLFPRVATVMAERMQGELLTNPDYRALYDTAGAYDLDRHVQQRVGLPVSIVETLRPQLDLAERLLETAWRQGRRSEAPTAQHLMNRLLVVRAMAAGMAERTSPTSFWRERYRLGERSLGTALQRLTDLSLAIVAGKNPLGIEETDVPLYFRADTPGADGRFSAISDYLIGSETAWVPTLVAQAERDLERARDAYVFRQDRQIQVTLEDDEAVYGALDLALDYGVQIAKLCGLPAGLTSGDVLEKWGDFKASGCHLIEDPAEDCGPVERAAAEKDPAMRPRVTPWQGHLTQPDVAYHLCRNNPQSPYYWLKDRSYATLTCARPGRGEIQYPVPCEVDGETYPYCIGCAGLANNPAPVPLRPSFFTTHGRPTPGQIFDYAQVVDKACREDLRYTGSVPTLTELQERTWSELAESRGVKHDATDLPPPPNFAQCVRGEIGNLAIEIQAADIDIQIAYAELQDQYEAYDIAIQECAVLDQLNHDLSDALEAHNETMDTLGTVKLVAQDISEVATSAKDCASEASIEDVATFVLGCAAGGVASAANSVVNLADFSIDRAQRAHDALVSGLEAQATARRCYNNAELHLVSVGTQVLRIHRAYVEQSAAVVRFDNAVAEARRLYDEGRAALAAYRSRPARQIAFDYWLDERIDNFVDSMRRARRALYVAVRALEYERQQSSAARSEVLLAESPADLLRALRDLQTAALTRGIDGHRANQLSLVLSLRQHVLQVEDRTAARAGERNLSDVERFRYILQSPRFAVFDGAGEYVGQRIPFTLAPLSALALGEPSGVPIFGERDCAERIWSINASIQGTDQLFHGDDTSTCSPRRCRIELEASNTFYSQWCAEPPRDAPFQTASVRPARNLLSDDAFTGRGRSGQTRARLGTRLNVSIEELERPDYVDGESTELATRGLYGSYALMIPASSMSLVGGEKRSDGLVLSEIDDILLRIDYTSVAR